MCGIAGFWLNGRALAQSPRDALRQMTDAIAHRGPDDSDLFWEPESGVGLGHRRLSIVDLSPEGRQPMRSSSGRYTIAFNGEVYNFRLIRAELEQAGLAPGFRGSSDTEVMLAAIEAWGLESAVRRFVGMFAFALWDRQERRLSLVRDRLGVKPLYYSASSAGVLFGSELRALLAFPGFERAVDDSSVAAYLRWGHVPAPACIYRGARQLEPGTILHWSGEGGAEPILERYWDARQLPSLPARTGTEAELLDQLDEALRSAVQLRMIADVPLGAFLSGGIDSSLVVALMQAQSTRPVRTFSIGNQTAEYDEGAAAAAVAAHLGTEHVSFDVTGEDALRVVPELGTLYDEPFADSSQIPTLLVSRLARKHVTVALTGDGGDETFGGYNRHSWGPRLWQRLRLVPAPARGRLSAGLLRISPAKYDALLGGLFPAKRRPRLLGSKVHKLLTAMGASSSQAFYEALCSQWQEPQAVLRRAQLDHVPLPELHAASFADEMMLLDLMTYLPNDVLTKVDRATMSVALEARAPFLDHRIVELGWQLPAELKVRGGVGKWALRQLLQRYVPRELVDRPKMGFAVPVGAWLRGPLRDWAEELMSRDRLSQTPWFNEHALRAVWREHVDGKQDHAGRLWAVLMFQAWLAGPSGPTAPLQCR